MILKTILIVLALIGAAVGLWLLSQMKRTRELAAQAEAAVPPAGRFAAISTGRLHYTDTGGSGRPVVMIHGLGGQLRSLTMSLAGPLSRDFRVIAIDRPGMGYSERDEAASARIDDQAGYVEELIDQLGLERPIILGHSLGGAIASALALRAPEKVGGLALIAPLLRPSQMQAKSFAALGIRTPWLRRLVAETVAVPTSAKNADLTRTEIFGPDPVPEGYTVKGGGLLSLRPRSFFNTSRDYMAVGGVISKQYKRYDEITCPVRVLYGTEDRILDYRKQGEEMSDQYPHFQLELVEGAGHMLPLTQVERTVETVRAVDAAI
ncbi:alpha/beta hydrolase [Maritimibacter sp. UBA3975]|uniref:alpha/beta fold hydrolase n=1 Tax=Maritimibacter sp. UBA3975 TaxID=1946833 RepID=UPI000C098D34|nr:alpha/beta hydrolase [Maritimibacter sp. UBA3975]MAM61193.1 alpha/beta hydrolase [Maritimibacter sp.]|tara:strand:+ start:5660 stop:6622 length:963 start_codon:yes stop_codon:yes gene_type:complete